MALIAPDVEFGRSAEAFNHVQERKAPGGEVRKLHSSCSFSASDIWSTRLFNISVLND